MAENRENNQIAKASPQPSKKEKPVVAAKVPSANEGKSAAQKKPAPAPAKKQPVQGQGANTAAKTAKVTNAPQPKKEIEKPIPKAKLSAKDEEKLSKDTLLKGLSMLWKDEEPAVPTAPCGDKLKDGTTVPELPSKGTMRKAIVGLVSKNPAKVWERKQLISDSIKLYGFSAEQLKDVSCESLSTNLKSITGVIINELVEEAVLQFDENRDISLKVIPMSEKEIKEHFTKKYLTPEEQKNSKPDGKKNVLQAILGQAIKKKRDDGMLNKDGATVVVEIENELKNNEKFAKMFLEQPNKYPNSPIGKILAKAAEDLKKVKSGKIKQETYRTALKSNVTQCINEAGGEFFERLSMMLIKAAYGDAVIKDELTAGPTDNGIDGKLTVRDGLGFTDMIFFQSKTKLKERAFVSIKVVREFIGVVTAFGATKGILITNSNFAKETRALVLKLPYMMLIDNAKLFELMIEYGIGVVKEDSGFLKIDDDLFLNKV